MKAQSIVDRLAAVLPQYTSGFSNSRTIVAAALAGTTVTITTDTAHGVSAGRDVSIRGLEAPVQIDAGTFARVGTTATFETVQEHDLTLSERDKAAGGKNITISGAAEAEFNGTFPLIAVDGRNKLMIAVDDSGPTTISGSPLVDDANGDVFNGLVAVTSAPTDTTFTYEISAAYGIDPVLNAALVQVSIRIAAVLDIQSYLQDMFTKKQIGEDTLIVQLGDVIQSKNRNEQTDAADSSSGEYAYTPTLIQPFALYIIQNTTQDLTGAQARDKVESEYIPAIFKAVLRASFDTNFSYSSYRATFTGHGVFAYSDVSGKNRAIYAHEVSFEQLVQITKADAVPADQGVALRDICYTLTTDLGTGELTANVDLDADAEPQP